MVGENLIEIRVRENDESILEVVTDKSIHIFKASCELEGYHTPYIAEIPSEVSIGRILEVNITDCFMVIITIGGYNTIQAGNDSIEYYSSWFNKLGVMPKVW